MPKHKASLNWSMVEIAKRDRLRLSAKDWQALETALGKPIPEKARRSLRGHCKRFLVERKLELEAVSLRDIGKLLQALPALQGVANTAGAAWQHTRETNPEALAPVDKAQEKMLRSTFGKKWRQPLTIWGGDIAIEGVLQRIYCRLANATIEVDLEPDAGRDGMWSELRFAYQVRVNRNVMLQLIPHLVWALKQAIADLDEELKLPPGQVFRSGRAFESLLLALWGWARAYDLPSATHNRNDNKATAFSRFAFELHKHFPDHLRDRAASPEALQSRLNELIREQKRRT